MGKSRKKLSQDQVAVVNGVNLCLVLVAIFLSACANKEEATTATASSARWMDQNVYFAYPDATDINRNNAFQKQKVQDALDYLSTNTLLGEGYFSYHEVDESELTPILTAQTATDFKSFVLIWPDATFNSYLATTLGGVTADPNAITVINDANKRQFFLIFKASCFSNNATCQSIGTNGLSAMISRQMGLLSGLSTKDCLTYPSDVMCASIPSDSQWASSYQLKFFSAFNNVLTKILSIPSYYK